MMGSRLLGLLVLILAPACVVPEAPASDLPSANVQCPRGCSGNGECINGVCLCMSTHMGADCATEVSPNCNHTRSRALAQVGESDPPRWGRWLGQAMQWRGREGECRLPGLQSFA